MDHDGQHQVHIQRDPDYTCSTAQDGSLKTDAADRYVPIPSELKEKLYDHIGSAHDGRVPREDAEAALSEIMAAAGKDAEKNS